MSGLGQSVCTMSSHSIQHLLQGVPSDRTFKEAFSIRPGKAGRAGARASSSWQVLRTCQRPGQCIDSELAQASRAGSLANLSVHQNDHAGSCRFAEVETHSVSRPACVFFCAWFRGRMFGSSDVCATMLMLAELGCCMLAIMLLQTRGACDAISNGAADLHRPM